MKFFTIKDSMLIVICIAMSIWSCSKDEITTTTQEALTPTDFFSKITSLTTEDDVAVYVDYHWNETGELMVIDNIKQEQLSIVLDITSEEKALGSSTGRYTIECENGNNSWTRTCSGSNSCTILINRCLKQGGCATICAAQIVYIPQTKSFYLHNN
ncbi:hypothetical protein [Aquimarina rhabdastrellae]